MHSNDRDDAGDEHFVPKKTAFDSDRYRLTDDDDSCSTNVTLARLSGCASCLEALAPHISFSYSSINQNHLIYSQSVRYIPPQLREASHVADPEEVTERSTNT